MSEMRDQPPSLEPLAQKAESRLNHALGMLRAIDRDTQKMKEILYSNNTMAMQSESTHDILQQLLENADESDVKIIVKHLVQELRNIRWNREYVNNHLSILEENVRHLRTLAVESNQPKESAS